MALQPGGKYGPQLGDIVMARGSKTLYRVIGLYAIPNTSIELVWCITLLGNKPVSLQVSDIEVCK